LKTVVESIGGNGRLIRSVRYGLGRRVQANHRSGVEIALEDIKTKGRNILGTSPSEILVYWVGGVRRRGGVSSIQAHPWNCGNSGRDAKRKDQVKKSKVESIEARSEDGPTRSSVEALVMSVERRGRVVPVQTCANSLGRMSA